MNIQYFEGLQQEKEIKDRYKELAKKHHPDLGGDAEIMKAINDQYEKVLNGAYQFAGKSITEIEELLGKDIALAQALFSVSGMNGLEIEICGQWLWITGNTKEHKEKLKECKFMWSKNKGAWYWRAEGKRSYCRNPLSLDLIRYKYGSLQVDKNKLERQKIA